MPSQVPAPSAASGDWLTTSATVVKETLSVGPEVWVQKSKGKRPTAGCSRNQAAVGYRAPAMLAGCDNLKSGCAFIWIYWDACSFVLGQPCRVGQRDPQ